MFSRKVMHSNRNVEQKRTKATLAVTLPLSLEAAAQDLSARRTYADVTSMTVQFARDRIVCGWLIVDPWWNDCWICSRHRLFLKGHAFPMDRNRNLPPEEPSPAMHMGHVQRCEPISQAGVERRPWRHSGAPFSLIRALARKCWTFQAPG